MFLGTISPIPYGPDHPKYTKHPDHPDLYPTKYPGEKTPNVTRYPTQPTEYVTRYPGVTTPYKGQPVYPVEPSHFQCQIDETGYTYDSIHYAEFDFKNSHGQDISKCLNGSMNNYESKNTRFLLRRPKLYDWFKVISFEFRVKNVLSVKLLFIDRSRRIVERLQVK